MSLATAIEDALKIRATMKMSGATGEELERDFEGVVRAVWPFTREWKYLCASCLDTGLEILICHDGKTCGLAKGQKHEAPHEYGVPCWCSKGARFRVKSRQSEDDVIAAAAKVSRPKRFGEQ